MDKMLPPLPPKGENAASTTPSGFKEFVYDIERGILNKTIGNYEYKGTGDSDDNFYDEDNDLFDFLKTGTPKPTTIDPYKDGKEMPREMQTFWDHLLHSTTPLYDNDNDYNYDGGSPYEAYDEYTKILPNPPSNRSSGETEYDIVPSAYLPRSWISYIPQPSPNTSIKGADGESVTYVVSGYQIAHAVYMGAVVLILLVNLIMILAILLQPRLRFRASTILLLNFFFIEVLLSMVDLAFTQKLLITDADNSMGTTLCLVGPWLLHIFQAAQPVALFILNVEAITTIVTPEQYDTQVGCRVSILLVLVTWLFGVALASIFVTRSELIETFIVIRLCYTTHGNNPISMNFLMGMLQLGGPMVVLIISGVTLFVVVNRRSSSPHLSADVKSRVRGSVLVLLAVSFTYFLVTLPVIIINARYAYYSVPNTLRAWITVQLVRRLGALFFPAFWWSRPDVRRSLKQLPSRLLCKVQDAPPPRPSVISLENDTETADLLPLELSDPQPGTQDTYRAI